MRDFQQRLFLSSQKLIQAHVHGSARTHTTKGLKESQQCQSPSPFKALPLSPSAFNDVCAATFPNRWRVNFSDGSGSLEFDCCSLLFMQKHIFLIISMKTIAHNKWYLIGWYIEGQNIWNLHSKGLFSVVSFSVLHSAVIVWRNTTRNLLDFPFYLCFLFQSFVPPCSSAHQIY